MSSRTNGTASAFMRAHGSPMVEITADVLDIARRIQEGDELWRGDRGMELVFNDLTGRFEVLALDAKGQAYIVLSAERCDQRILVQLAESDWARGASRAIAKLDAAAMASEKAQDDARRDIEGAMADKVAWGIKRTFAAHLGGKSYQYSFNSGGR